MSILTSKNMRCLSLAPGQEISSISPGAASGLSPLAKLQLCVFWHQHFQLTADAMLSALSKFTGVHHNVGWKMAWGCRQTRASACQKVHLNLM